MPAMISAIERPLLWAVLENNAVIEAGITEAGNTTITGLDMVSDASENAFLGKVAGAAGDYQPLPAAGTWLEAGTLYAFAGGLVLVRQSHSRTEHAPADVPALLAVYRENAGDVLAWVANEFVSVGTRRLYQDKVYEALQAHTTQSDWQPNAPGILGVLWREVVEAPATPEWAAGIAYKVGDEVTYQGATYRCLQAHTSAAHWYPTAPGILNVLWLQL